MRIDNPQYESKYSIQQRKQRKHNAKIKYLLYIIKISFYFHYKAYCIFLNVISSTKDYSMPMWVFNKTSFRCFKAENVHIPSSWLYNGLINRLRVSISR
jgi:hypothetical protein